MMIQMLKVKTIMLLMKNAIYLLVAKKDAKTASNGIQKNVHHASLISLKMILLIKYLNHHISLALKKRNAKVLNLINLKKMKKLEVFQRLSMERDFVIIVN